MVLPGAEPAATLMVPPLPPAASSALLNALREEDRSRITDKGSRVVCDQQEGLQRAGDHIKAVYFPESGWVSVVAVLECGRTTQVGLVGREGMVGMEALLGGHRSSFEWVVGGAGSLIRVSVCHFRDMLRDSPTLGAALAASAIGFHDQVAQTAACNVSHTLEQRLARLLLMVHDRSGTEPMLLTQDLLSDMLGVRRAGVSVAASRLKTLGCIGYDRGVLVIMDRAALRAVSCECYRASPRREDTRP